MAPPLYKFTSYDLDTSIGVAEALDAHGGVASADELAVRLGYKSRNNGAFLTRLANARLFGLVDGNSTALSPSKRAIDIIRPTYPEIAARARLAAFELVPLYKAFLETFHGQVLPDEVGMRNALENRFQIDPDRTAFVLTRLMDSAQQAGLFSVAGNRSRMIRPTIHDHLIETAAESTAGPPAAEPEASSRAATPAVQASAQVSAQVVGARASKLVDGALDMLPDPSAGWNEDELQQWMAFFDSALRVVYRLPSPSPSAAPHHPAPRADGL